MRKIRRSLRNQNFESENKAVKKEIPTSLDNDYQLWLIENYVTERELTTKAKKIGSLQYQPVISLITPVFSIQPGFFQETIKSVLNQIYHKWEICLAIDNSLKQSIETLLTGLVDRDRRLKIICPQGSPDVVEATNLALEFADGEFIAFLQNQDTLAPHALFEVVALLNEDPEAGMIYTDEDRIDERGYLSEPFFKPDWCPDSFLSRMYTRNLAAYRKTLADKVGHLKNEYKEEQLYDFVLRLTEQTDRIYHIPQVVYHRRTHSHATAFQSENRNHDFEAGQRAIEDALKRRGVEGVVQQVVEQPGFYIVRYAIEQFKLVSIIIPSKDNADLLGRCLQSIFQKTSYPSFEVILIDNGSVESKTLEIIEGWRKKEPIRFHCFSLNIPFNFSTLCNWGFKKSKGRYVVFLNDDTEVITDDWLEAMVEQAQRPSVGAVGALLLFDDNTIQHAGAVVGLGGIAGHSHRGCPGNHPGYRGQVISVNNYLSVAGTCLMCRRELFEEIGPFDERLPGDYEDLDFCLKLFEKGLRNVYLPHVKLYHYESMSRGRDYAHLDPVQRDATKALIVKKWGKYIDHDPCYSPNLTRSYEDYRLRIFDSRKEVHINSSRILKGFFEFRSKIRCVVDELFISYKQVLYARGWAMTKSGKPADEILVYYNGGLAGSAKLGYQRPDVIKEFPEFKMANCGFYIFIKIPSLSLDKKVQISLRVIVRGVCEERFVITNKKFKTSNTMFFLMQREGVLKFFSSTGLLNALESALKIRPRFLTDIWSRIGPVSLVREILRRIVRNFRIFSFLNRSIILDHLLKLNIPYCEEPNYYVWLIKKYPDRKCLRFQAKKSECFSYRPKISIIMPVYNIAERYLKEAIESVLDQIYTNWELCIADDASTESHIRPLLEKYGRDHERIKVVFRTENGHISKASNSALSLASGDFIAQLDHDDFLAPHTLFKVVELLNRHPDADMIYSDEDKADEFGRIAHPFFKPDWCPDTFLTKMYTCHFAVFRKTIIDKIGGFRSRFDGAEDYDLVLRFSEHTQKIFHIPDILYHWRMVETSVAGHQRHVKPYVYRAAKGALKEAIERRDEPGEVSDLPGYPGYYRIHYQIRSNDCISIIIHGKGDSQILERCLFNIMRKSNYKKLEIIILNSRGHSMKAAGFDSFEKERKFAVKIVDSSTSNDSAALNKAVSMSSGKQLLFLDRQIDIISSNWIEYMVEQSQRDSIGAVGVLGLCQENKVCHAGFVLGIKELAGYSHRGCDPRELGHFGQVLTICNVSAVSCMCLMCKRRVFDSVRGYTPDLVQPYADIDFCLKLLQKGLRNVYLPHVKVKLCNALEDDLKKKNGMNCLYMRKKWEKYIERDPCYNQNLTREFEDFRISIPRYHH